MDDIEQITREYIADNHLNDLATLGVAVGWAEHIDNIYAALGLPYFRGGMPMHMDTIEEIAEVFDKVCAEQQSEHE